MHHTELKSEIREEMDKRTDTVPRSVTPAEQTGAMRLSMHDGVAVWCDCCSCEAEPYWLAVGEDSDSERDE